MGTPALPRQVALLQVRAVSVAAMPTWFSAWLEELSGWPLVLFICAFFIAVTWIGIVVVHPFLRRMIHGDEPSNEVIIHAASLFGLSYAVLLGLLTIATFDSTKSLVNNAASESSDLSTLYLTADGYPEPLRGELKGLLQDYTRYVIDKDWPAHRRGLVLKGGEHRLQVLRQTLVSYEPTTKTLELLHNEMLRYLNALVVARDRRLSAVTAAIPPVLWYVVVAGALMTIAYVWMLHMKLRTQFLLGGVTALGIGILIFLIYAMDRPLQGAVSVSPEAYVSVYDSVMKWDDQVSVP
jgi:hypothetical protein